MIILASQLLLVLSMSTVITFYSFGYPGIGIIKAIDTMSASNDFPEQPTTIKTEACNRFTSGILEESPNLESSSQDCWWLDSGGLFYVEDNDARTVHGNLDYNSSWQKKYASSNPLDTQNGTRPQNIFRLISRNDSQDVSQELFFRINGYHLSPSMNRNVSNGVLLMSRFKDQDNLYYAGLRVDGNAVIKKKINGVYTTLAIDKYESNQIYNRVTNPIILPMNTWIGEKLVTKNNADGSVELSFYIKLNENEDWKLILDVRDSVSTSGTSPLVAGGKTGIRSDFMDVEFKNYNAVLLP